MSHNRFIEFIKPTVLKISIFLIIGYFIVPVFSQSSLCLDLLADQPHDNILPTLPCIKLETIPQHLHQQYITKNSITYQLNSAYYYDLTTQYFSPLLNSLFVYMVSCGIVFSLNWLLEHMGERKYDHK